MFEMHEFRRYFEVESGNPKGARFWLGTLSRFCQNLLEFPKLIPSFVSSLSSFEAIFEPVF